METLILVIVLFLAALIYLGGWIGDKNVAEKDIRPIPCPRKTAREDYETVAQQLRKETSNRRRTSLRRTMIFLANLMNERQCDCGGCHE